VHANLKSVRCRASLLRRHRAAPGKSAARLWASSAIKQTGDEDRNITGCDAVSRIHVRAGTLAAGKYAVNEHLDVAAIPPAVVIHVTQTIADAVSRPEPASELEGSAGHDRRRLGVGLSDCAGQRKRRTGTGPAAAIDGEP